MEDVHPGGTAWPVRLLPRAMLLQCAQRLPMPSNLQWPVPAYHRPDPPQSVPWATHEPTGSWDMYFHALFPAHLSCGCWGGRYPGCLGENPGPTQQPEPSAAASTLEGLAPRLQVSPSWAPSQSGPVGSSGHGVALAQGTRR